MWTGYKYAVHYTDRFIFGTDKLNNTYGGFTSNFFFENKGKIQIFIFFKNYAFLFF